MAQLEAAVVKHPAKFSGEIVKRLLGLDIPAGAWVLDPFAGVGTIHTIGEKKGWVTQGVELEPEWAQQVSGTMVGDATALPADWSGRFDAVVTSPCYGNRMADTYDGRDGSKRQTYRISLGRMPTEGNAAAMQWGSQYRLLHLAACREMWRVLKDGGMCVVNMSDHIRGGTRVDVSGWWADVALVAAGFEIEDWITVRTPRMRMGSDGSRDLRVDGEDIIIARK